MAVALLSSLGRPSALPDRRLFARIRARPHRASERVARVRAGLVRAGRLDATHDLWKVPANGPDPAAGADSLRLLTVKRVR